MTSRTPAPCRSLLFVPAGITQGDTRRLAKAHLRGAHALILDLEDAVPKDAKDRARQELSDRLDRFANLRQRVLVRVNADPADWEKDLDAAVRPGVRALMLPKTEDPRQLSCLADRLAARERERGLPEGGIGLVALVESPVALFALPALAAAPRVRGLALGSEDFALALGVRPTPEALTEPCRWIALAAAAAGVESFALPVSLAAFDNPAELAAAARRARAMGITGALCVHPAQVAVVNEAFAPTAEEIAWARLVTEAWETAATDGEPGAIRVGGTMVDAPVLRRARAVVDGASASPGRGDTR